MASRLHAEELIMNFLLMYTLFLLQLICVDADHLITNAVLKNVVVLKLKRRFRAD